MKKLNKVFIMLLMLVFSLTAVVGCGGEQPQDDSQQQPTEQVELTIAAAASLQDAANELKELYNKENPDIKITYNFASSGTLQKQIEEGAPADLFISAGKRQMDELQEQGLIVDESRQDLLGNTLVLIAPENSSLDSFEGLKDDRIAKLSMGTPDTVPAGKYAQESLTSLGLWEALQNKMVMAKDVRQVLTYVETGNVDAGLVYNSDAIMGKGIKVAAVAPKDSHKPIVYPMALIKNSQHGEEAQAFADFLVSEEAMKVFEKYGFEPIKK